jgi:hypothetical protein
VETLLSEPYFFVLENVIKTKTAQMCTTKRIFKLQVSGTVLKSQNGGQNIFKVSFRLYRLMGVSFV